MPVSPARAAAFDIVLRIERESSYASELLHSASYENLSHSDHALTTELVKRARKRSAAPFVNAVLRKLSAKPSENRNVSDDQKSSPEILAGAFSHPVWLIERWVQEFGPDATRQICQYDQSVPTTTIRLRTPDAASELAAEGISLSPG